MKRWRLRNLIMWLACGAALNVAVAWLCAWLVPYQWTTEQIVLTRGDHPTHEYWISRAQRSAFGVTQSIDRVMVPSTWGVGGLGYILEFPENQEDHVVRLQPGEPFDIARLVSESGAGDSLAGLVAIWPWRNSAGWPLRSMACWWDNLTGVPSSSSFAAVGPVQVRYGVVLNQPRFSSDVRALPFMPLWTGFIVNSILYALLAFMAMKTFVQVRRAKRLRRGLCPRCAYPIGISSMCTECGEPLSSRSSGREAKA